MKNVNKLSTSNATVGWQQADTQLIKIHKSDKEQKRQLLDFIVDGNSPRELIKNEDPNAPQLTTGLQDNFIREEKVNYLKRLLGKLPPDLESGRVALYICPIDGDLGCDAVGCRIDFKGNEVTWYDFAWDSNTGECAGDENEPDAKVKGLDSYTFDHDAYEALIMQTLNKL